MTVIAINFAEKLTEYQHQFREKGNIARDAGMIFVSPFPFIVLVQCSIMCKC